MLQELGECGCGLVAVCMTQDQRSEVKPHGRRVVSLSKTHLNTRHSMVYNYEAEQIFPDMTLKLLMLNHKKNIHCNKKIVCLVKDPSYFRSSNCMFTAYTYVIIIDRIQAYLIRVHVQYIVSMWC